MIVCVARGLSGSPGRRSDVEELPMHFGHVDGDCRSCRRHEGLASFFRPVWAKWKWGWKFFGVLGWDVPDLG